MEPTTHPPDIAELLSFFDYAHLPPHLAEVSKDYHATAEALVGAAKYFAMDCLLDLIKALGSGREDAAAKRKLDHIISALRFANEPDRLALLRTLLEAKDCAVRAALVRHRAELAVPRVQEALAVALAQDMPRWLAREAVGLPAEDPDAGDTLTRATVAILGPGATPAASWEDLHEREHDAPVFDPPSDRPTAGDTWQPSPLLDLLARLGREPATPTLAEAFEREVGNIFNRRTGDLAKSIDEQLDAHWKAVMERFGLTDPASRPTGLAAICVERG